MKKIFVLVPVIICLTACMSNISRYLSSYVAEVPKEIMVDEYGRNIDKNGNVVKEPILNPYFSKYEDIWGKYKGKNLSLPILVKPEDKRKY